MVSLFAVQKREEEGGEAIICHLLALGGTEASRIQSLLVLTLEEFDWISKRKGLQIVPAVTELHVNNCTVLHPITFSCPKRLGGKEQGMPVLCHLGISLQWHSWTKATEFTTPLHSPVKIPYEYCIMKVHNTHNLSCGSQIHYWAPTYEPTDL